MTMELTVLKQVQEFQWNYEQVKQNLQEHIQKYANLVVTEENLKDMENVQKEIAKLRITLSKFRLAVKGDMEKPYKLFEMQVNELSDLIQSTEKPIKDQLEKYETKRRDEKAVEVQSLINKISTEMGLEDKYRDQIMMADKYLNRTQKWSDTKEDIQMKVCWFLDIQQKDREAETFKQQKIEMAKFLCESLSAGLATPLRFEEIESRIDNMDIGTLRKHIESTVTTRKEREERAAQMAIEKAERDKKVEEDRIAREAERVRLAEERKAAAKQVVVEPVVTPEPSKPKPLYKAQFVVYNVTDEQINEIKGFITMSGIKFEHAVKPASGK